MANYIPYFLEIAQWQDLILAQFGAATIQGQLDFEGSISQRSTRTHMYTISILSLFVCTYSACEHTYIAGNPLTCGEILRVVFIGMSSQKHAATFRGRRDFEVQRDFEEIQYLALHLRVMSNVSHRN